MYINWDGPLSTLPITAARLQERSVFLLRMVNFPAGS